MAIRGVEVERRGEVGWIILNDYQETTENALNNPDEEFEHHSRGIARALDELRWDQSVRVIVMTGKNDGEFYRVCRGEHYDVEAYRKRLNPLNSPHMGNSPGGPHINAMHILAIIEKPVIARLNGDAIGLGQAMLWGCDMIVAREDAVIADVHTGQRDVIDSAGEVRGFPWAVTPGDGAMSFAPLYMTPTKLKEYMFLSRAWTAKQLADMNIVNYAVPADQLDTQLDEIIEKLLARPATVLARTKKVINKRMVEQWNMTQDLASAYEILDFYGHAVNGDMD